MPLATSVFTRPWPWRGCQCACVLASGRPRVFLASFMSLINLVSLPTHKVTAAWSYFASTPAGQSPNSFAPHHFFSLSPSDPSSLKWVIGFPLLVLYICFSPALWLVFHCETCMAFHLTNVCKPIDSFRNQEAV